MRFLRKNTAVIITVGPFYDKTDGVTIETGLTITNERITLVADTDDGSAPTNILDNVTGAASGTANDLNYITNNDAGLMQLELAAADVNRNGRLFLTITDAANHVPVFHEFMILPANIYDSMILGTDLFDVSLTQVNGAAQTATLDAIKAKTDNLPSDPADESALEALIGDLPTNAELATALGTADDAVLAAVADLPTNTELAAALAAADDAVLSAISGLNNLSIADIRTAIGLASANLDTQLADLPTNAELTSSLAGADDAVLSAIAALNNLSVANIRTAVGLATANLDTQLAAIQADLDNPTQYKADVSALATAANLSTLQGNVTTILADYARRTGDYSTLTAALVWNALTSGLTTSGSIGKLLADNVDGKISEIVAGGGLDAAGVRAAIGMASANLDTQLGTVAKTGADSDTLETLSDQIDDIEAGSGATPAEVWAYGTRTLTANQPAVVTAASIAAGVITVIRGDTATISLTGLGSLANNSKVYFTVKGKEADPDTSSIIQIEKTDGLKYIKGAVAGTAANGSLVITDEALGNITITIAAVEMAKLDIASNYYDVQVVRSAGTPITTLAKSTFVVSDDITRAVT